MHINDFNVNHISFHPLNPLNPIEQLRKSGGLSLNDVVDAFKYIIKSLNKEYFITE